jgi:hypothetical protein
VQDVVEEMKVELGNSVEEQADDASPEICQELFS